MHFIGFATLLLIFQCTTAEINSVYAHVYSDFKVQSRSILGKCSKVLEQRAGYKGDGPGCTATLPNSSEHPH